MAVETTSKTCFGGGSSSMQKHLDDIALIDLD
jgi:hypothetical protein